MAIHPDHMPKYPLYILSKGRYDSLMTMKSLDEIGAHYNVAVEPQEYDLYAKALEGSNATILKLPFSNHGKGGGPARNWCWEHSMLNGHKRHWIIDDNIRHFYRFHNNKRIRVKTPAPFRAIEDFSDRYKNVQLSAMQYHFFCPDNFSHPAVLLNTRVMSCILINNSCQHKWRGKYNEDVDLSLRVLKDGDCTLLFYAFLCGKMRTGTVKGGNTTEIYGDGTFEKSKMLAKLHPDVVTLTERYGRWHHHVDMRPFRHNKLEYADDFDPTSLGNGAPNEYGMKLVYDYGNPNQREISAESLKSMEF